MRQRAASPLWSLLVSLALITAMLADEVAHLAREESYSLSFDRPSFDQE
jgi:hypothetical protein